MISQIEIELAIRRLSQGIPHYKWCKREQIKKWRISWRNLIEHRRLGFSTLTFLVHIDHVGLKPLGYFLCHGFFLGVFCGESVTLEELRPTFTADVMVWKTIAIETITPLELRMLMILLLFLGSEELICTYGLNASITFTAQVIISRRGKQRSTTSSRPVLLRNISICTSTPREHRILLYIGFFE